MLIPKGTAPDAARTGIEGQKVSCIGNAGTSKPQSQNSQATLRATLTGDNTATAAGITVTRDAPMLELCRALVAVASPASTNSTICATVNPCATITDSVQPSGLDASNASARWRSGSGDGSMARLMRRRRQRLMTTVAD